MKTTKTQERNKKMGQIMALARRASHVTDVLAECKPHFGKANWDAAAGSANDCLVYVKSLFVLLSETNQDNSKIERTKMFIAYHEKQMYERLATAKKGR